ncbi:MAG: hypothetical protein GEEBNDBF_01654 [bacterium]|nr:hypothetical protein [bacterium]
MIRAGLHMLSCLPLLLSLFMGACGTSGNPQAAQNYADALDAWGNDCAGGFTGPPARLTQGELNCLKCLEIYCNGPGTLPNVNCQQGSIIGISCMGCDQLITVLCLGQTPMQTPAAAQQQHNSDNIVGQAIARNCQDRLTRRIRRVSQDPRWANTAC